MTNLDTLFDAFPGTIEVQGHSPIDLRSTDNHNQTNFITDEGFLAAFYRGDFIYCVRDYFHCETESRYTINSISFHLPSFEVIRCVESTRRLDLLLKGSDWWAVAGIMESSVIMEFGANSLARCHELALRFNLGLAARDVPNK